MTSTYVAGGHLEYGRYGNPTWTAFEDALGALEGGRCLSFSSGLAAVSTVLDLVGHDGLVVAPAHSYTGTLLQLGDLESRGRIRTRLVDIADTAAVEAACDDAALVWFESPTNPALEHGVDIVVHSATKYLAGHSDVVLGAVVTGDEQLHGVLKGRRDLLGAIPGPFEAWLALRGLRTLHLRVERAQANATELARRLAGHPAIGEVRYPGFGGVVSVVLAQGAIAADLLVHKTRLWVHATSLGGVESTFERRRRWKAEPATIPDALVRLSVGVEDVEDLWADLERALGDLT
jgi:cystathionine gamma-synthase